MISRSVTSVKAATQTVAGSLSERLAAFATGLRPEDLPPEVVADARRRLIDTVGVALAGVRMDSAPAVRDVVFDWGGAQEATVIGWGGRLPAPLAGFANAALAHAPDFDDTHSVAMVHMSSVAVPAALAMAERNGLSPRRMLTAMVAGGEIGLRLGAAAPHLFQKRNYHATAVVGPFCSAAIGCLLASPAPDERAVANALGIAGSLASGLRQGNLDGTWIKRIHPAWSVQNGLEAGLLASRGFTGPREVLEGRFGFVQVLVRGEKIDLDGIVDDLGERWVYPESTVKPYPNGAWNHSSMDAVALIMNKNGLRAGDVERVDVTVPPECIPIVCEPREVRLNPATPYHMKFSLQYSVAMLAVLGHCGLDDYSDGVLADPRLRAFAERVHCAGDPSLSPHRFPARVRLLTTDGRAFSQDMPAQRGGPGNPMTDAELRAKYTANASGTLGHDRAALLLEALEGVWDAPDLGSVVELMQPSMV